MIDKSDDIKSKKNKKVKQNLYCGNCGNYGHIFRNCDEPIISFGVILASIITKDEILIEKFIEKMTDEEVNIKLSENDDGIQVQDVNDIETFCKYKDKINFLLIRRKHTLGYLEFIRGRYEIDDIDYIILLFKQMTVDEIKKIGTLTFDDLWNEIWGEKKKNVHQNEYTQSQNKFNKLKENIEGCLSLDFYVNNVDPSWSSAEWGFPKGRRNKDEEDKECAEREFREEGGFDYDEYKILSSIEPSEEQFFGTNGVCYKHVYYPALAIKDKEPTIDTNNKLQSEEIGDIGWFTYEEIIKLIRPYHSERKKILSRLYMHILNLIISIKK